MAEGTKDSGSSSSETKAARAFKSRDLSKESYKLKEPKLFRTVSEWLSPDPEQSIYFLVEWI